MRVKGSERESGGVDGGREERMTVERNPLCCMYKTLNAHDQTVFLKKCRFFFVSVFI